MEGTALPRLSDNGSIHHRISPPPPLPPLPVSLHLSLILTSAGHSALLKVRSLPQSGGGHLRAKAAHPPVRSKHVLVVGQHASVSAQPLPGPKKSVEVGVQELRVCRFVFLFVWSPCVRCSVVMARVIVTAFSFGAQGTSRGCGWAWGCVRVRATAAGNLLLLMQPEVPDRRTGLRHLSTERKENTITVRLAPRRRQHFAQSATPLPAPPRSSPKSYPATHPPTPVVLLLSMVLGFSDSEMVTFLGTPLVLRGGVSSAAKALQQSSTPTTASAKACEARAIAS